MGIRTYGHPHVRRRVVGGLFLLFPHVALPFSALDYVRMKPHYLKRPITSALTARKKTLKVFRSENSLRTTFRQDAAEEFR